MLVELEFLESSWESSWKSPVKYLLDENGNQETAAEGRPALLPELCFLLESLLDPQLATSWIHKFHRRYYIL
jgi:hypothetical protein